MSPEHTPLADLKASDLLRPKFSTVRPDEPCARVLHLFAAESVPAVVVTDDKGRFVGFVSERDVLRSGSDAAKTPIEHLLHPSPTVRAGDSIVDVAARILDDNARGVAVTNRKNEVEGILVREDLIAAAGKAELADEPISKFVTGEVVAADADDTVAKALSRMRERGISHMPVIDEGRLAGIVTVHDIIRRVLMPLRGSSTEGWKSGEHHRPLALPLRGIMTGPVVTVGRSATYGKVAAKFARHRIGSVVVTRDGEYPLGIVTRRDLVEPIALLKQDVPTLVVHFSSKDTSREGYESSGSPNEVRAFLERYQDQLQPALLTIHVKKQKQRNRRIALWTVNLNLTSDLGKFAAIGDGWGMQHATRLAVDKLEREVRRVKEEKLDHPTREFIEELIHSTSTWRR